MAAAPPSTPLTMLSASPMTHAANQIASVVPFVVRRTLQHARRQADQPVALVPAYRAIPVARRKTSPVVAIVVCRMRRVARASDPIVRSEPSVVVRVVRLHPSVAAISASLLYAHPTRRLAPQTPIPAAGPPRLSFVRTRMIPALDKIQDPRFVARKVNSRLGHSSAAGRQIV